MSTKGKLVGMRRMFKSFSSLRNSLDAALNQNCVILNWPSTSEARHNFGDKLNPYLVKKLTDRKVYNSNEIWNFLRRAEYKVIGSSLGSPQDKNKIVWGTGFISYRKKPVAQPLKICAVRGPLSRRKYLDSSMTCPDVYGDPALLLPRFIKPRSEMKYKIGFIPQWRDENLDIVKELRNSERVKYINIKDGIQHFINQVTSCERILTSSLHALIIADAFNVPSLWLRLSENPLGDYFKFQDYYESIGYKNAIPEKISTIKDLDKSSKKCTVHEITVDLENLIEVCPF